MYPQGKAAMEPVLVRLGVGNPPGGPERKEVELWARFPIPKHSRIILPGGFMPNVFVVVELLSHIRHDERMGRSIPLAIP